MSSPARSGSSGKMSALDLHLCREALSNLMSKEYSSKNYLFLEPVDLSFFPTYTDFVKRPMDLGTLRKNLEAGRYSTRESFFSDALLCFENALSFHGGKKESQWIIKLAKDMMKIVNKERRRADKRAKESGAHQQTVVSFDGNPLQKKSSKKEKLTDKERKAEKLLKFKKEESERNKSKGQKEKGVEKPALKLKLSQKTKKEHGTTSERGTMKTDSKKKGKNEKKSRALTSESKRKKSSSPPPASSDSSVKTETPSVSRGKSTQEHSTSAYINFPGEAQPSQADPLSAVSKTKMSIKLKSEAASATKSSLPVASKPKVSIKLKEKSDLAKGSAPVAPKPKMSVKLKGETSASSKGSSSLAPKPKMSLKLKAEASASTNGSTSAAPKPKVSLKLKGPSSCPEKDAGSKAGKSNKSSKKRDKDHAKKIKAVKAKPSKPKPKLKLTLSLSKKNKVSVPKIDSPPEKVSKGKGPAEKTSSQDQEPRGASKKKLISSSPVPAVMAPSRGKELPSSVAAIQAKKKSATEKESAKIPSSPSPVPVPKSAPSRGKELPKGVTKQDSSASPEVKSAIASSPVQSPKAASKATPKTVIKTAPKPAPKVPPKAALKINMRLSGPSRGKELPKSAASTPKVKTEDSTPSAQNAPLPPTQTPPISLSQEQKKITKIASETMATTKKAPAAPLTKAGSINELIASSAAMNETKKLQCNKVLSGLKRRQAKNVHWFLNPVSDPHLIDDYRQKIPNPMDLGTITAKLDKNEYSSVTDFVLDLRRVFGNCLRYNTGIKDTFRPVATEMICMVEDLLAVFIAKPEAPVITYPRLLYCWKLCLSTLDSLLNLTNPTDGHQTAHYFLHPVSFYCGDFPPGYLEKVKTPMDLGTLTSKLVEGSYLSVGAFVADCRLVCENCKAFYGGREDGKLFTAQAERLQSLMAQQLGALVRFDQSPQGAEARNLAFSTAPISIAKPQKAVLHAVMKELRAAKYTDRFTKLTESATLPFEKPVNLAIFPDYLQYVDNPMDLETIDRKIEAGVYNTAEDFEYDVSLIFRNCERYNVPKKNDHIVLLSKAAEKKFKKQMKLFETLSNEITCKPNEGGGREVKTEKRSLSPPSRPDSAKPNKKIKTESSSNVSKQSKATSRVSTQTPTVSTEKPGKAPRAKSPKTGTGNKKKGATDGAQTSSDTPVPLHVAIAQVKESFPVRRPYKVLESWEGACARFFRELMRHAWISAARPKFIFHVPVPILFPEVKDAYAAKIEHPMDLTTAEAKLLQGGIYTSAQEFINDVALVFFNAITFNRAGHDDGEPMSCAYFDASRHLLRYTRWLSLEYLSSYLSDDPHTDEPSDEGQINSWQLTKANKKKAREEMENIVLQERLEKGEEGDRFTWMEAECEKLLKALRHQSDLRYMTFFIQPHYPADYAAYISKPMDWERCQRTLQQRSYETFGEVVNDLRLIFSNALKYNARAKGTDTVSGRAYDAALYMSAKLESAIDKMMLSVSDRLEREKIDHVTAEREIEAAERAEEERLRAMWQQEREKARATVEVKTRVETVETVKLVQPRRLPQRKEMMDFEFPFFDEDEGHHEQSHMEALRQQKMIFEKQQKDRAEMRRVTLAVGIGVFERMAERADAIAWAQKIARMRKAQVEDQKRSSSSGSFIDTQYKALIQEPSTLASLKKESRKQIKMEFRKTKKLKRKKVTLPLVI